MARSKMTQERYAEIKRMLELGISVREIMRTKRATRRTIRQIRDGNFKSPSDPKELLGPIWTNQVQWEEILKEVLEGHPIKYIWSERAEDKIGYKAFLDQFHRKFPQYKQTTVVHRIFAPGERCEVDYAGGSIEWVNIRTGEVHEAPIFVGALGCSQLIFACAREDAKSPHFIDCHVKMYEYFGGVPKVTVPDCLKTGVIKPHLYDPDLNPSYADMAGYYNTAIVPARTRRPKDKAIVEGAVKIVMRYFRWKYRGKSFDSIQEINEALCEVMGVINQKCHSRFKVSRQQRWTEIEKPSLSPLPNTPYEYTETKTATVHPASHIVIENYEFDPAKNNKKVLIDVLYGKVRSKVEQKYEGENKFQVKTPSAVAGVRGTDFFTSFNKVTNSSKVVTFKGEVAFGLPGPGGTIVKPVFVRVGEFTVNTGNNPPAPAAAMPKSELIQFDRETKADSAQPDKPEAADGANDPQKRDSSSNKDQKGEKDAQNDGKGGTDQTNGDDQKGNKDNGNQAKNEPGKSENGETKSEGQENKKGDTSGKSPKNNANSDKGGRTSATVGMGSDKSNSGAKETGNPSNSMSPSSGMGPLPDSGRQPASMMPPMDGGTGMMRPEDFASAPTMPNFVGMPPPPIIPMFPPLLPGTGSVICEFCREVIQDGSTRLIIRVTNGSGTTQ